MKRVRISIAAAALLTSAAAVALRPQAGPVIGLAPGHALFHANCPPGSHGKPRFDGVAKSLANARATRPLDPRAITVR